MEDSNRRILNPWLFHLQKLALELKCPICLDLLNQPVLLPCNHLFCKSCIHKPTWHGPECPVCKSQYVDLEIRSAPYMENVVTVYKSLCATSLAKIFHPVSSDVGRLSEKFPVSAKTNPELKKEPVEIFAEANSTNGKSIISLTAGKTVTRRGKERRGEMILNGEDRLRQSQSPDQVGNGKHTEIGGEEIDMNQIEQLSPGSNRSLGKSRDAKRQKKSNSSEAYGSECGFCHSSEITDETGPMLHYFKRKLVHRDLASSSKAIHVHQICIDWTPRVYYEGDEIKNLEIELARASRLRCSHCGQKGAALGCYVKACRKTYHAVCASKILDCRWDCENFLMLCPFHKSITFPSETQQSGKHANIEKDPSSTQMISEQSNFWSILPHGAKKWVFCGSALSSIETCHLVKFARSCGATVSKFWKPDVTHVIAATDANGACIRTMKILMAILHGRWIVTMEWIKSCQEANKPMDEKPYEVSFDNHGSCDGPKMGRILASDNGPKLFDNLKFYFSGDFVPATKNDLLNLVKAAGGTVIESEEPLVAQSHDVLATTLIVYYNDDHIEECLGDEYSHVLKRLKAAEDLAERIGSRVIKHTWILESIAAYELQPLPCC